jgi:hypothetical protein
MGYNDKDDDIIMEFWVIVSLSASAEAPLCSDSSFPSKPALIPLNHARKGLIKEFPSLHARRDLFAFLGGGLKAKYIDSDLAQPTILKGNLS